MGLSYPAGWRQWRRLLADGEYAEYQALNRFDARFRMARGMGAFTYPGMGVGPLRATPSRCAWRSPTQPSRRGRRPRAWASRP